ncbi:MAG: cytidylate kinase-like family protein [Lentisphaeria bacterium]|nr:cytidylate kinase-like family protein [Lentisphaeria bacterium]
MNTRIITISREFGSGGRTIGKLVAERLGIACYDRELVAKIAKESGLAEQFILENGEYAESANAFLFNWALGTGLDGGVLPISDQLYIIQHNIIRGLAEKEPCVIVGRCADYILRERADCLNIFIHADMEFRINQITRHYGETQARPEKFLRDRDKKRQTYYRHYTGRQWGALPNYQMTLESSALGIEACAELIVKAAGIGR